jgi:16S rRNA (cytidine1402-2'-O)-methyltransferase
MNDENPKSASGKLYVVATPIGHKEDITLRAVRILSQVDQIAAEDTRKTRRFLQSLEIKSSLISYHEHNEEERTPALIRKLRAGLSIALVSNAGTPSVSDPGYRLIKTAIAEKIAVIPIPGVSAATTALSVAGLPTDSFLFVGFSPRKKAKRLRQLDALAALQQTIIFYESPKRILALLDDIISAMGNRQGVLAREMTKPHEEFVRGRLSSILAHLKNRPKIRGECTLVVAGSNAPGEISREAVIAELEAALTSKAEKVSETARKIACKYNLSKNKVYQAALEIKKQQKEI